MFRRKRHRGPALLLAFALLFTSQSVPAAAAESDIGTDVGTTAGVTSEISGGETITANGIYEIADGATGVITVAAGVTDVTLTGSGVSWEGDTMLSEPFTDLRIDCSGAEGVSLTLRDVYLENTAASDNLSTGGPAVDFEGSGNELILEGTNLIEKTASGSGNYAGIHVAQDSELTVTGAGTLYLYKRSGAAGFGGNAGELNGDITFGESGSSGPAVFAKGTMQGALIGAGTGTQSASGIPGAVTFDAGTYNLVGNSRGAIIGGSAGSAGASAGTTVYFNGGSVNINVDFTGAAVGGGGYESGNDASGGSVYFSGGSVRVYVDKNAAGNTDWGTMSEGINDLAITALKQNNSADKEAVYKCVFDTAQLGQSAEVFDVQIDGKDFFSGGLHGYSYVQEALDKGDQITISHTPSNWTEGTDTCLYFYLTAGDHTITVNGETFRAVCDQSVIGTDAEHTTGPFRVEKTGGTGEGGATEDVSWYSASDSSFTLTTPAQLAGLAAIVNGTAENIGQDSFAGKTVTLGGDLNLSAYENWTPAGGEQNAFAGTFDGAGHKITGLSVTDAEGGYKGLFGNVTGTLKDFSVSGNIGTADSPVVSGSDNIGGAAGFNGGTVSGVTGDVEIFVNTDSIYAVGGIAGQNGENGKIENCGNLADITGTKAAGGIAGRSYGVISGCFNAGDITGNGGGKDGIGGIAGIAGDKQSTYENSISGCYNTGTISNDNGRWHGGIAGMADSATSVRNCYNTGTIAPGYSWNWNPIIGHVDSAYSTVSDNYSLQGLEAGDTDAATRPLTVGIVTSEDEMKSAEFIGKLNGGGEVFVQDMTDQPLNGGFPVLAWQAAFGPSPDPETAEITFVTEPENASVRVKDADGQTVNPAEENGKKYLLTEGVTYFYEVSASGYTSISDQITVSGAYTVSVTLSAAGGSGGSGGGGNTGSGNVNASVWDGKSIDVSWYDPDETVFYLSKPAQLAGLAAIVNGIYNGEIDTFAGNTAYIVDTRGYNGESGGPGGNNQSTPDYHYGADNFEGKTVYLTADIDMSGGNYMPVGGQYLMDDEDTSTRVDASFCGTFDGNGHSVTIECDRHCSGNYGDGSSIGLIGRLGVHDDDDAELRPDAPSVCNVAVYGSVRGNRSVGSVVGKIGKTEANNSGDSADGAVIENCANFASVSGTDSKGTGGIVGAAWNGGVVRNCYNSGTVNNTRSAYGGIAGENEIALINCYNAGEVTGAGTSAAIATDSGGSYENCYWLDTTADTGVYGAGADGVQSRTSAEMKSEEFLKALGSAFAQDTRNINNGYPVLTWQNPGAPSGGGSGGGGGVVGEVDEKITVDAGTNGSVSVTPSEVNAGDTVTITVTPNDGYLTDAVTVREKDGTEVTVENRGDGTYTFIMPEGEVTVTVTYRAQETPGTGERFTDVPADAWYKAAVEYVVSNGYFNGVSSTQFDPQGTMTRAMFATAVGRLAGVDESDYSGSSFADVPEGQWYSAYVKWASDNGIVNGVGGGNFNPDGEITREQMAALLYRYAQYAGIDVTPASGASVAFASFPDSGSVSDYAGEAMIWAVGAGIISGSDGRLLPQNDATRAQVAQIVMNYGSLFVS